MCRFERHAIPHAFISAKTALLLPLLLLLLLAGVLPSNPQLLPCPPRWRLAACLQWHPAEAKRPWAAGSRLRDTGAPGPWGEGAGESVWYRVTGVDVIAGDWERCG